MDARGCQRLYVQHLILEGQRGVGGNDVDMVGSNPLAVLSLSYGHGGMGGEQLDKHAGMVRVEVLHQDKSHPGVGRHMLQKSSKGLQPTCRRTNTDS